MNKKIHEWYNDDNVLFELIRYLKYRELALLVPKYFNEEMRKRTTRSLRGHNTQSIRYIYGDMLQAEKKGTIYNFYYSLAKFKEGVPKFTANLKYRKTTQWNLRFWKEIISYDCLIDIDAGDHSNLEMHAAKETAIEIFELFEKMQIPFECRFSGCGFHFIIPYEFLKNEKSFDPYDDNNFYRYCLKITTKLYNQYSEQIDYTINDSRRVVKIPYSLAVYEKEIFVCTPINNVNALYNFELKNFNIENYETEFETPKVHNKELMNSKIVKEKFNKWLEE